MPNKSFVTKRYRTNECLELVYIDVCGPFNIYTLEGYEYFLTFTNDYIKFGYIHLIYRKFDIFDKFIEFKWNQKTN